MADEEAISSELSIRAEKPVSLQQEITSPSDEDSSSKQTMAPSEISSHTCLKSSRKPYQDQRSHTCRVCIKAFPSLRALNGHMRVHGGSSDASGHGREQNTAKVSSSTQIFRDFDLPEGREKSYDRYNLPATYMEDEEEEQQEEEEEEEYVKEEEAGDYETEEERSIEDFHDRQSTKEVREHVQGSEIMYNSDYDMPGLHRNTLLLQSKELSNQRRNKREPLYEFRQNPKQSRFMEDADFWGLKDCHAKQVSSPFPSRRCVYPCSVCGRTFSSEKALYGHMRSHPDRAWRGAQPPNLSPSKRLLPLDFHSPRYSDAVDLHTKLQYKKQVSRADITDNPQKRKHAIKDAIEDPSPQLSSTPETALASESLSIEEEAVQVQGKDTGSLEAFVAIGLVMLSAGKTDLGPASIVCFSKAGRQDGSNRNGCKKQERKEAEFQCKTCNRWFTSPQALGGHRTSHMKWKCPISKHVENVEECDGWLGEVKGHSCSICHRTFLTGQALGGHKRCHWTSEKTLDYADTNREKPLDLSLNEGRETATSKESYFNIDLNLPVHMDDVDDHGLYSYSLSSSLETVPN